MQYFEITNVEFDALAPLRYPHLVLYLAFNNSTIWTCKSAKYALILKSASSDKVTINEYDSKDQCDDDKERILRLIVFGPSKSGSDKPPRNDYFDDGSSIRRTPPTLPRSPGNENALPVELPNSSFVELVGRML